MALQEALAAYHADKRATSAAKPVDSLGATWKALLRRAYPASALLPLSPESLAVLGAAVKAGGYRSVNILYQAKKEHSNTYEWTTQLQQELKEAKRSVLRGMGPSRQPAPSR